jgi:hypothetical protein
MWLLKIGVFSTNTKRPMVFAVKCNLLNNAKLNKLSIFPALTNFMVNQPLVKKRMGVASKEKCLIAQNISENGLN